MVRVTNSVSVALPEQVWRKIDTEADFLGMSRSRYVSRLVESVFEMAANGSSETLVGMRNSELVEALTEEQIAAVRAERGDRPGLWGDDAVMQTAFLQRPSLEWLEALWAADVPILPAQPLGEILRDSQAAINGYTVEVEDPCWGKTRQAGTPFHTTPPSSIRSPAPRLGEHTKSVLNEPPRRQARSSGGGNVELRYPLENIKVLDLGNFLAGPFATMLLADLGADVIKLEAISGDKMRPIDRVFAGCQRGKRGIAVDLKNPLAREVIEELVRRVDVVHHNLRYPAARKLGIDYESLRPLNPSLIYCHTSSYWSCAPIGPPTAATPGSFPDKGDADRFHVAAPIVFSMR